MKRPVAFAVLFSFVLPGLGQIYNNDLLKGLLFILASVVTLFFFGLGYVLLWMASIIDAYLRARAIHSGASEA